MAYEQNQPCSWVNIFSLVSEEDLAKRWHKSIRTLQRYRVEGTGPAWIRIGGSVIYHIEDVLDFENAARMRERSQ